MVGPNSNPGWGPYYSPGFADSFIASTAEGSFWSRSELQIHTSTMAITAHLYSPYIYYYGINIKFLRGALTHLPLTMISLIFCFGFAGPSQGILYCRCPCLWTHCWTLLVGSRPYHVSQWWEKSRIWVGPVQCWCSLLCYHLYWGHQQLGDLRDWFWHALCLFQINICMF